MTSIEMAQTMFLVFATLVVVINPQKVPPGVNPTTYQQPPPPQAQQYQPPPPPQPSQYQQQPIQSAVPQEQKAPHAHHDHHGQPQLLNTVNLAEEKEHMQEHLNVNIDTSKMTEQELQFHYFKMHDADNNNKLDGCELIKSLIHWHDEHEVRQPVEELTDTFLSGFADALLVKWDFDGDGFIDYDEYRNMGESNVNGLFLAVPTVAEGSFENKTNSEYSKSPNSEPENLTLTN